jgi:hypothetical protein
LHTSLVSDTREGLLQEAKRLDADIIVVGSRGLSTISRYKHTLAISPSSFSGHCYFQYFKCAAHDYWLYFGNGILTCRATGCYSAARQSSSSTTPPFPSSSCPLLPNTGETSKPQWTYSFSQENVFLFSLCPSRFFSCGINPLTHSLTTDRCVR